VTTALQYLPRSGNFTASEWPDVNVLALVDARVLQNLDTLRDRHGQAIHPSRHPDGWARASGSVTSQHYAVGRLSTAADVFPAGDVLSCWLQALAMPVWGGIGLYLDTRLHSLQPGAMMHLDIRTGPRKLWIRNEVGEYISESLAPQRFWDALPRVRRRQWTP